jgi:RNA recognition motif-containing protein
MFARAVRERLFIGGIAFDTTEDGLRTWMSEHGVLAQAIYLVRSKVTGLGRGFAFADLHEAGATQRAMDLLRGHDLCRRVPSLQDASDDGRANAGRGRPTG